MKTIAVFPGQGSQSVGMGRLLCDEVPEARRVFEEVDEALAEKLSTLIFDGPADRLTLTENAQPALMATSLAAVRALEARSGRPLGQLVHYVAGHSLGEYSALAAAGALTIGEAARLLKLRGRAMQRATPEGVGAMAAILGLDAGAVEAIAIEAAADQVCELANDNSDGQAVISGDVAAIDRAIEIAKAKGAKRSMRLQVSAPFHCALMGRAAEELQAALEVTRFKKPAVPLVANVTAEPVSDPALFAQLLERQVTARVRWRESMTTMQRLGCSLVVELGAGKVLSGLCKRGIAGASVMNVQEPADIDAVLTALTTKVAA